MTRTYLRGFGNQFESEALAGVLVKGRNSPQKVPFGLYAEQLSGSAFTRSRHVNLASWLYRIRPSVLHGEYTPVSHPYFTGEAFKSTFTPPMQMRWDPLPYPTEKKHFVASLFPFAGNGNLAEQNGAAIYLYAANQSMQHEYFVNHDGDFLIVLQEGELHFQTEFGVIEARPGEIVVIQRGIKFQVKVVEQQARGYVCENFGLPFVLPDLGVIGSNGLAKARDFQIPTAHYHEATEPCILLAKFQGLFWSAELNHNPLDVVAWHGNYAPYKYDLALFNTINTVSFDHPDPSIFTVLTSPSAIPGVANVDFVIFPPRWMVAENTFRPPYFHRNIMSEYMGLIRGRYDAKEFGFIPGSSSLHNCMTAHGPDTEAYQKAISTPLQPEYYANTLAFMFESRHVWQLTSHAYQATFKQNNYSSCWRDLKATFNSASEVA